MTPAITIDKGRLFGLIYLFLIALTAALFFISFFSVKIHEDVSFLIYLFITFATALCIFVLLFKKHISGRNILLSFPITMLLLLLLLVLVCRWWYTPEGLVLASPDWLGGFWQMESPPNMEKPSKIIALLAKAFSFDFLLLGNSVYGQSLFNWPGLVIWILTVLGFHLSYIRSQRLHKKELEREYSMMLSCIQRMYGVKIDELYLSTHLRQATKFEVAQLIEDNKAKEVERKHTGYYIPPINMFIKYSLEKRPDLVFHLDRLEILNGEDGLGMPPLEGRVLSKELSTKDFYVFKYDSFGAPGTHLCARIGYVLYEPELQDIVADAFYGMS